MAALSRRSSSCPPLSALVMASSCSWADSYLRKYRSIALPPGRNRSRRLPPVRSCRLGSSSVAMRRSSARLAAVRDAGSAPEAAIAAAGRWSIRLAESAAWFIVSSPRRVSCAIFVWNSGLCSGVASSSSRNFSAVSACCCCVSASTRTTPPTFSGSWTSTSSAGLGGSSCSGLSTAGGWFWPRSSGLDMRCTPPADRGPARLSQSRRTVVRAGPPELSPPLLAHRRGLALDAAVGSVEPVHPDEGGRGQRLREGQVAEDGPDARHEVGHHLGLPPRDVEPQLGDVGEGRSGAGRRTPDVAQGACDLTGEVTVRHRPPVAVPGDLPGDVDEARSGRDGHVVVGSRHEAGGAGELDRHGSSFGEWGARSALGGLALALVVTARLHPVAAYGHGA